jgi:hypothetical protein
VSLTAAERETIITGNDEDDVLQIWTAQRPMITRLRKNPAARLIEEGTHDGSPWARFEFPPDLLSFRSRRTTRTLSEEHKAKLHAGLARSKS